MSVIQNKKKPLVVLTGPTAVGKTKLSIALAKAINGEILSADSMQVYKHMDIGSAKIRPEEMEGVPIYSLFTPEDIPGYATYSPENCAMCRAGERINALANSYGLSAL